MTQNYLQNGKNLLKKKLELFNEEIGKIYYPEEMEEMFKLIDTLDRTEFNSLNYLAILMHNDGFESGYKNGVYDEKQKQKKKKSKSGN